MMQWLCPYVQITEMQSTLSSALVIAVGEGNANNGKSYYILMDAHASRAIIDEKLRQRQ